MCEGKIFVSVLNETQIVNSDIEREASSVCVKYICLPHGI